MNSRYIILLLLLLLPLVHSDCVGGYNDTFNVRVLDAKLRPVPNALVSITFDRGVTFGPTYVTSPLQTTNGLGEYPFTAINGGTNTRTLDCKITVFAEAGSLNKTITTIANDHGPIVDVQLSVYPIIFNIKDQFGAPLPGAVVALDNIMQRTDSSGSAIMFDGIGNLSYLVNYLDGKQAGTLSVTDDTVQDIVIPYHDIQVGVMDDFGNPLNASIAIFNGTFPVENGHYEHLKSFGSNIPYTINYNGSEMSGTITPEVSANATVIYDIHAPIFQVIKNQVVNGRPELIMQILDPGTYSSGVDGQSVKVSYRIQDNSGQDVWTPATTFTSAKNTFTSQFPQIAPNTIVQFHIEVKDKTGNKALLDGSFSTASQANQIPQNDTNTQLNQVNNQGIPLLYIIIGVIMAILVVYLLFRIRPKQ